MINESEALVVEKVIEVEADQICVNPHQPRRHFGKEELNQLAESIRSVGLIHPPVVRWNDTLKKYELISGERRFRACQLSGMLKIPVMVKVQEEEHSAATALIENIQRVDLNPMEVTRGLFKLKKMGHSQEKIAEKIGKKRSTIANFLRLLHLPASIQKMIEEDKLSMGHAKAVLSLEEEKRQLALASRIVRESLSVRQAEVAACQEIEKKEKRGAEPVEKDPILADLERRIEYKLGTKVTIQDQGNRGKILIDYYGLDDLDRLLEILEQREPE